MAKAYARKLNDGDRLQLVLLRLPDKTRSISHRSRAAQVLAWLLMSKTMGDYRAWRRTAGRPDDGGYIHDFIKGGILRVTRAPKRKR